MACYLIDITEQARKTAELKTNGTIIAYNKYVVFCI